MAYYLLGDVIDAVVNSIGNSVFVVDSINPVVIRCWVTVVGVIVVVIAAVDIMVVVAETE